MRFPSFTLFNLLSTMFFILLIFVISKILTLDWKLRAKENIYFIFATIFASIISVVNRDIFDVFTHTFGDLAILITMSFYFYRIKGYPCKKTTILTFIASYISITMLYISTLIFYHAFSDFQASFNPDFLPVVSNGMPVLETLQVLTYLPFFVIPTFLVVKFSRKARQTINQDNQLQTILMYASIIILGGFHAMLTSWRYREYAEWLVSGRTILFTISCVLFFLCFLLYARYINAKHERLRKESEHSSLQYYVRELEQNQIALQKFKHDYQNILLSMRAFIQDRDMEGLEQYFSSKIEVVSETITKDSFTLQGLHKIKVREIKSLLTAKLAMAQMANPKIHIIFEVNEEIEHIPLDSSIALVRMLGIILDNAIEALMELDRGKLLVACHKWEAGITFIVQNTCRPDIPPLHELTRRSFSTKKKGQGLGLSILSEIADSHPNVMLETRIDDDRFIQRLLIENEEDGI